MPTFKMGSMHPRKVIIKLHLTNGSPWLAKATLWRNTIQVGYTLRVKGVLKDDRQAVKWYRKAADQDDAPAQNNLAFRGRTI